MLEVQIDTRHIGVQRTIGYDQFKPPLMINNDSESEHKKTVDEEAQDGQSAHSKAPDETGAEFQITKLEPNNNPDAQDLTSKEKLGDTSKEDLKTRLISEATDSANETSPDGKKRKSTKRTPLKIKKQFPYDLRYMDTGTQCMIMTE